MNFIKLDCFLHFVVLEVIGEGEVDLSLLLVEILLRLVLGEVVIGLNESFPLRADFLLVLAFLVDRAVQDAADRDEQFFGLGPGVGSFLGKDEMVVEDDFKGTDVRKDHVFLQHGVEILLLIDVHGLVVRWGNIRLDLELREV